MPVAMNMDEVLNKYTNVSRFEIKNDKESSKPARINIYGVIGGWFNELRSKDILRKLNEIDKDEIHLYINSPGGDVFESIAIANQLKRHKAKVVAYIDGIAASGASLIANAADVVIMPKNTMMMIHYASTYAWGNKTALQRVVSRLEKIDEGPVINSYLNRFVGEREELETLLEEETFLTADECLALGFADEVTDEIEIVEPKENDDDPEEDEEGAGVEAILAKYSAQNNQKTLPKEPDPEPAEPKQNLGKLFLNLK